MISCILLAAGSSSRFGSPKALAAMRGGTVIEHLVKQLLASNVDEIIVCLGALIDQIKPLILKHKKIHLVYNKDYNFGQTSSFKVALKEVDPKSSGVMLLPIDYPILKVATINQLIDHFLKHNSLLTVPLFNGIKGHPPIFHARLRREFIQLDYEKGINTIIHQHEDEVDYVSVDDPGVVKTFSTKKELESILIQEII